MSSSSADVAGALDRDERRAAAGDIHTDPELLQALATCKDRSAAAKARRNPATPRVREMTDTHDLDAYWQAVACEDVALLTAWARSERPQVRAGVAANPQCPASVLAGMVTDPVHRVRRTAATNPSANEATLTRMAADESERVRAAVAANPTTPEEVVWELVAAAPANDPIGATLNSAVSNPRASERVLQLAASAGLWSTKAAVAEHPNAPTAVLVELAQDERFHSRLRQRATLPVAAAVEAVHWKTRGGAGGVFAVPQSGDLDEWQQLRDMVLAELERIGVAVDNVGALAALADEDLHGLTPDDVAVRLALRVSPN